jgi:hypothetical protein
MYSIATLYVSISPEKDHPAELTLCQDLPFAGLCSAVSWNNSVELFEEIFHLTTALALCKLVADSQLWRAAIVSTARNVDLVLKSRHSVLTHAVVVVGWCVLIKSPLAIRKAVTLREYAASNRGCSVAVGSRDAVTLRVVAT